MQVIFKSTVPKEIDFPQSNADCLNIKKNSVTLSDGASMSYDSKAWATILVNNFGLNGRGISRKWLDICRAKYNLKYNYDSMNWLKQAAYEKGSHATFLSLKMKNDIIEITAIGDTVVFILEASELLRSFPIDNSISFNRTPELFSTNHIAQGLFTKSGRLKTTAKIKYSLNKTVPSVGILMTDALAEWALKSVESGSNEWKKMLGMNCDNQFYEFIIGLRNDGKINIDDTTIIIVDFAA